MPGPRTTVVRFGSLGDLCLLAWSLAAQASARERSGERRELVLVTKAIYAPLMARVPGLCRVEALPGGGLADLRGLARRLRAQPPTTIVDAHAVLRSRLLIALTGRRAERRLSKDTTARLLLLGLRRRSARLERTMRDRFDEVLAGPLPPAYGSSPDLAGGSPPFAALARRSAAGPRLGLAPGARWAPKRWPAESFAALLRGFRERSAALVRIFLGPQERSWFAGSALARAAAAAGGVEIVQGRDLVELAEELGACATVVTNDSGLLHLAEATGTPVLALFGPTVREFGYFPTLPQSRVLEEPLACRPCSRNGKRRCWRRDHACLRRLAPERVLEELLAMEPWAAAAVSAASTPPATPPAPEAADG